MFSMFKVLIFTFIELQRFPLSSMWQNTKIELRIDHTQFNMTATLVDLIFIDNSPSTHLYFFKCAKYFYIHLYFIFTTT